jgi:hypothetical protein
VAVVVPVVGHAAVAVAELALIIRLALQVAAVVVPELTLRKSRISGLMWPNCSDGFAVTGLLR